MANTNVIRIDPKAIQTGAAKQSSKPKSMEFPDYMGATSAMGPFGTELTYQSTGNVNAASVLSAAFASFPSAASSFAGYGPGFASYGGGGGYVPYSPSYAGGYGGGIPGLAMSSVGDRTAGVSGGKAVPGTNMSQFELMDIMNQNNLQLLELQAIMQSNMQVWNTKSNILNADHRAKLAMIEKFTAR